MMSKIRYNDRFQLLIRKMSSINDAFALGIALAIGLIIIVPIFSLQTPVPILAWVALVGTCYGIITIITNRLTIGAYAALLVTITFSANIPLASKSYLHSMTRDLGPSIWLAHLPLGILLILLFIRDKDIFLDISQAESLLGAFIGWVVLAAILSNPIRFDTALFFGLFIFWGLLVFVGVRRAHKQLPISPKTTMNILFVTILLQSLFGLAEASYGRSFGLTQLGELSPKLTAQIAHITIGSLIIPVGTFVSGFTGMALGGLIILIFPYATPFVLSPKRRYVAMGSASIFLMLLTLRLIGSDAARGAAFISIGLIMTITIVGKVKNSIDINKRQFGTLFIILFIGIGLLAIPSSESGATPSGATPSGATPSGATPSGATPSGATPSGGIIGDMNLTDISIPLFDLSTLTPRLQQYSVGIKLFIENPILGIGGANFKYMDDKYGIQLPIHNIYLALLVETGIIGAALYIGFIFTILHKGLQSILDSYKIGSISLATTGLIGYLAVMFWDYSLLNSVVGSFTFYTICAVISSAASGTGYERQDTKH